MLLMTVKEYRKAQGLTQAQLAEMVGCSQAYLSEIENGATPGRDLIARLLEASSGEIDITAWLRPSARVS